MKLIFCRTSQNLAELARTSQKKISLPLNSALNPIHLCVTTHMYVFSLCLVLSEKRELFYIERTFDRIKELKWKTGLVFRVSAVLEKSLRLLLRVGPSVHELRELSGLKKYGWSSWQGVTVYRR